MSYDLQVLVHHQDALLLAEAIGWLHDYRKCSDEHLRVQAANLSGRQALPRNELATHNPSLQAVQLQLPVQPSARTLTDLLDDRTWNNDVLGQFLSRCHNTSHFDKQEPAGGKQSYPGIKVGTAFGFEKSITSNLTSQLWTLPWNRLVTYASSNRDRLRMAVSQLFSQTVADTRRPINEIDLWSWGLLVGSLYKATLSGALLTKQTPAARDLHWRLLGIRVDGLDYLLDVARIPDLLARQEVLNNGLDRVRELIETTYPLGSEVYRDENGSIYVVPNIPDLLSSTDGNGNDLRRLIMQKFAKGTVKDNPHLQLGGELLPHVELEMRAWWGQDPDWRDKTDATRNSPLYGQPLADQLPSIEQFLSVAVTSPADPNQVAQYWSSGNASDICTVCGLRPQGPSQKSAERHVCDICEQRRGDRSESWATSHGDKTIWTDEVADINGRLALLVGRFDLANWLEGSLVESLLLVSPNDPENANGTSVASKTASFSRLRRIWETTRRFWLEVQDEAVSTLTDDRRRLKIYLDSNPDLGPHHVYELNLEETELSMVWNPPQNGSNAFLLSTDNLGYVARQLGAERDIFDSPAAAAIYVEDCLNERYITGDRQPFLRNPDARTGQGRGNSLRGRSAAGIDYQDTAYAPVIPILAEPRTFMALAPANKAMDVIKAIKTKYGREMGKVRNCLPLHLGVVYAGRRTPLASMLDAGRRMLHQHSEAKGWQVKAVRTQPADGGTLPQRFLDDARGQFAQWYEIDLEKDGRQLTWYVPAVMGAGQTEDAWYPYVFLDTSAEPADRNRRFQAPNPFHLDADGKPQLDWLVHAGELEENDVVYFTPSTFDFEYLDASARRFEVAYGDDDRRLGKDKKQRPYLLEEVDALEEAWQQIACLSTSQIKALESLIEAKRRDWDEPIGTTKDVTDPFHRLVQDALREAKVYTPALETAALTGMLADTLEIHLTIHKDKPQKEND